MRGQKGFTLVELLIVIAILGVLVAVIVPNLVGIRGIADETAANTEAGTVRVAVLAYSADNDGDYPEGEYSEEDIGLLDEYIFKNLKGTYSVNDVGEVEGIGGWAGLEWDDDEWVKVED